MSADETVPCCADASGGKLQKLQKFPECNLASRKGYLLRLKRTISHPNGERFTPAANLPFPCSVTTIGNDDMKFIAQQD